MAKENGEKPVIEFDIDALSAKDLGNFMGNVTGTDNIQVMSEVLTRIVTKCPAEWGPREDPETFANLSWRVVWKKQIFPAFREALKNDESE
jgi:hypothetical protein